MNNLENWDKLLVGLVLVIFCFFIFSQCEPSSIEPLEVEEINVSIKCLNPIYNESDNYWYCNIDDVVQNGFSNSP